ncbi:MAG: cobyric acid synthase [Clostridia bacterium]|nr:cobyric acid synthase [Clostridia bacterium]
MAKVIMVQGTMSNAGKSLLAAGLCRVFSRDGYRVRPFKSQNMALNSFVTPEGLEIGRAQAMQAEACGVEPSFAMNPILLKPTADASSQVIVNGRSIGNMTAREYFQYKLSLIPEVKSAFRQLADQCDIVVIEGAGSPAEINLRQKDIVNMGLAEMLNAPVILVGDIDRGGVFAQLLGTYMLFSEKEKSHLAGLVINKFRGDKTLLDPGIEMMKDMLPVPFVGVVPYTKLRLEDEDSLSERFLRKSPRDAKAIDIVCVRLPWLSNFTDLDVFEQFRDVSVRYVDDVRDFGDPDMVVIPGSKNTIADLRWIRSSGMEELIRAHKASGKPLFGICGGFQILGREVCDPLGVEDGGSEEGLGLLPIKTVMEAVKTTRQFEGSVLDGGACFPGLTGRAITGYEIHMGKTVPVCEEGEELSAFTPAGTGVRCGNVYGTYVHGFFDEAGVAGSVIRGLAKSKGVTADTTGEMSRREFKEKEYDRLADVLEENMDMKAIYGMLREARISEDD